MLNKEEVFSYLNSGVDKSGYLKKEIGFSKKFPELYEEFLKVDFPEELKVFPFKQRLWHFLKDDYTIPTCKICGKKVNFETRNNQFGYKTYCCGYCAMQDNDIKDRIKKTNLKKYGVENYSKTNESKEKIKKTNIKKYGVENTFQFNIFKNKSKQTCLEKYGVESYTQTEECKNKIKETNLERYGVEFYTQTEEYKNKSKQTCLEKYGVENPSQIQECKEKEYQTKKKNHSFNSSKIEEEFKEYLTNNNIEFIQYYKSDLYPFECDFYIPKYDLYIEIQGSWTHGFHPFDENNKEDIKRLEFLKEKSEKSDYYKKTIYVWCERDNLKRKTAKENNLNYLEIFSHKINNCIKEFEEYIKKV